MIKNYFKVAVRSLTRNAAYTVINILGLAIGLGCFIIVISFNQKELSYEKSFPDADRIFRITTYLDVNGAPNHYPLTHFPAPAGMLVEYPEVEKCLRLFTPTIFGANPPKIKKDEIVFSENRFFVTDSTFFEFFPYEFKYGSIETALSDPYSVVLTEETAIRYFGDADPTGKSLLYNDTISLTVTGVLKKPTFNTHLQFDFLTNARNIIRLSIPPDIDLENAYVLMWHYGYIRLRDGKDAAGLQAKLKDFSNRHYTQRYKDNNGRLELQAIGDIHLKSTDMIAGDISAPGNIAYVYVLGIVGICVLGVACFNFINLATSRYLSRSKEVGIRKAIGAERKQLIGQFISEATVITFLAGFVSVILVIVLLPSFNSLANASLTLAEVFSLTGITRIFVLFVLVGTISGFYPAVVLSGMKPALVLKGSVQAPASKFNLRKWLVVLQFTVSLVLIMGTFIVMSQLHYLRNKDMGFDKEQVLVISDPGIPTVSRFPVLKDKLLAASFIQNVTSLSHDLGQKNLPFYPVKREGKDEEVMLPILFTGFDFLETFNIKMKQGRFFDIHARGDSALSFIINESAAKSFGWDDAENKALTFGANPNPNHRVIGVIEDFNFNPLQSEVSPLVIKFGGFFASLAIKLKDGDHSSQVEEIERIWKEVYPEASFNYYFLDQGIDKAYAEEDKLAKIYSLFCGLAIFIACLGLFALASYTVEKRKKEIAVRKVLGSTASGITLLIYKEFMLLIAGAFLLASPIAFFVFNNWLEKFAYRVAIEFWVFLVALGCVSAIAAITVLYQTLKAGMMNPAVVLKNE
ncbi:MAG: ABC transporter permease [Cyclobacteriaceae bacterium]|nr:ABC transporter permease [Cyclobacteriaceae bacterium]